MKAAYRILEQRDFLEGEDLDQKQILITILKPVL